MENEKAKPSNRSFDGHSYIDCLPNYQTFKRYDQFYFIRINFIDINCIFVLNSE